MEKKGLVEVAGVQERTNEILATLAQRQIVTEEALAESHRILSEKQATTEENLNALLLALERHIARHR